MKYFFEAGMGSIPVFLWQELLLKHSERAQDVRWTSVLRGPERSGDFPNKQGFRGTKSQAQLFNINSINLIISEVYVMILSERRCSLYA